jgi:cysteine desulfurase/selenocysteine lyase
MRLTRYTLDALRDRFPDSLPSTGRATSRSAAGAVSFLFDGIHAHDISQVLDEDGVCVRAGHHCAKPLMRQLGVPATTPGVGVRLQRRTDVDVLVEALAKAQKFFDTLTDVGSQAHGRTRRPLPGDHPRSLPLAP